VKFCNHNQHQLDCGLASNTQHYIISQACSSQEIDRKVYYNMDSKQSKMNQWAGSTVLTRQTRRRSFLLSAVSMMMVVSISVSKIPSSYSFNQFHPTTVITSGGRQQLMETTAAAAAAAGRNPTLVSMTARRRRSDYDEADKDDEEGLSPRPTAIPQLPPMSYWRATGTSTNEEGGTSAQSSSSSSVAASSSSTASGPAFVSPKFELQYTCNKCETRNRVLVSRQAYREGMVIAICNGCKAKHMIADNLHKSTGYHIEDDDHLDLLRVSTDVFDLEKVLDLPTGRIRDENGNTVLE